jgi:hypothetical protein
MYTFGLLGRKISHRTHTLVYESKQMCSDLLGDGVEVEIMWIPAHVGSSEVTSIEWCCFCKATSAGRFSGFGKICFAEKMAGEVGHCKHW